MGNWCITNQRSKQDGTEYITIISVFVGNHNMFVLVGESGKWEARCKRIKDTAQHTSCLLQSSDTMAVSTYIIDVTNTEYIRCTLRHNRQQNYHQRSILIFTHEHNYLKEEERGTQSAQDDDKKHSTYWEPTGIRRHGQEIQSLAVYDVSMIDCYLLLR